MTKLPQLLRTLVFQLSFAVLVGLAAGGAGVLFYHSIAFASRTRNAHPMFLFLLPLGGLLIVFLYRIGGQGDNKGTNLILLGIHENEDIPAAVAPLMFIASFITHLLGGSAGREGAALQIGGSIGRAIGRTFHFKEEDIHLFIMCGMSACFSAVFGTPMAAAIFSMEVLSIGIMHYTALLPCVVASYSASILASYFGAAPEHYALKAVPALSFVSGGRTIILGIVIAAASVLFCQVLHRGEHIYKKYLPNPYMRIVTGGFLVIALVYITGTRDYLGAGIPMIERCFDGSVPWYAFLLKILFTAITLGAGYKGGEIVPAFFTGATLGCVIAPLISLPSYLCAACGMAALFCGATNCPVTSILIAIELFGISALPYYVIAIAVSFMFSGYYSLYSSQKFHISKYRHAVINKPAK